MQSDLELFGLLCCTDRNSSSASQLIVEYANWYVPVTLVTASVSVLLSIVVFIVHGFVRYRRSIQVADNIASRAESAPPSTRYSAAESNSHSLDVVSLLRSDSVEALADSRHVVPISIIRILQHSQRDKEVVKRCNETKSLLLYLFACDLLGCFFTALRSTLWISRVFNVDFATDNMIAHVVCSSGTVLIMTFYSCSMFWTIAFSYDVKRCWDNKESLTKVYHLVCWSLAIILGSLSEFSIYLPQFTSCPSMSVNIWLYKIVQLCVIVVTLFAVTILYCLSCGRSKKRVRESGAQSARTRMLLQRQFSLTVFFMWLCWLPCLLMSLLLLCSYIQLWYQLSVVFNCLVAVAQSVHCVFIILVYIGIGKSGQSAESNQLTLTTNDLDSDARAAAM